MILLISKFNDDIYRLAQKYPIGYLHTPKHFKRNVKGIPEAADNGCFVEWNEKRFVRYLHQLESKSVIFVTAPDVVADHDATINLWKIWSKVIRQHNLPVAFVLQDGVQIETVPWNELDAIFIGGSTEFKLSELVKSIVAEAKKQNKWVHMGRVNSKRRMQYASDIGCDSVDGSGFVRFLRHLTWGAKAIAEAKFQNPLEFDK